MIWYARPREEYQDCYRCANKCVCDKFSRHVHEEGPWPGFEECDDFEEMEDDDPDLCKVCHGILSCVCDGDPRCEELHCCCFEEKVI